MTYQAYCGLIPSFTVGGLTGVVLANSGIDIALHNYWFPYLSRQRQGRLFSVTITHRWPKVVHYNRAGSCMHTTQ